MMRHPIGAPLLAMLAVASGGPAPEVVPGSASERRIQPTTWQAIVTPDTTTDGDLLRPHLMAAVDSSVLLYDYGDAAVKKVSSAGRVLWSHGRLGRGPGEYANPTALVVDDSGQVWVLDPSNLRITILSPAGSRVRDIRLISGTPYRLLKPQLGESGVWAIHRASDTLASFIAVDGSMRSVIANNLGAEGIAPMLQQGWAVRIPGAERAFQGFTYRGDYVQIDLRARTATIAPGIEDLAGASLEQRRDGQRSIQRVDPRTPRGTLSMVAFGDGFCALFFGSSEHAGRVLDCYSSSGAYIHSLVLPERVYAVATTGDTVFGLVSSPFPGIRAWHPAR